jgi:hypothetical protein
MAKTSIKVLNKLKEQREKIDARIQATEARIKHSERKKDVRKKILIGAYYLDQAKDHNTMDELKLIMDKFLKRDSDRELFGLESLPDITK